LLLAKTVKGADPKLRNIAGAFRRRMDELHTRAENAGITLGYVEDTGYLQRIVNLSKAQKDPVGFERDATTLYELVYDRNTAGLNPNDMLKLAREVAARSDPKNEAGLFASEIAAVQQAVKELDKAA